MQYRDSTVIAVACAMLLTSIQTTATSLAQEPIDLEGVREEHVMIPMRDGKGLSSFLFFPPNGGQWPVLYTQRHGNLESVGARQSFARLAQCGYVVCAENFRGAQKSEGTWVAYRALGWGELQDGYDTVEWLAVQPWSNGKIGTFGGSQAAIAQNFLAVTRPPHLVAQYMTDTGLSLFHEGHRIGGTTRPNRFKELADHCRDPRDNHLLLAERFAHPTYDAYWADEDCTRHFDKMDVPCITIGSWYDFMCRGCVGSYVGRQHMGGPNSRGRQKLVLGPWRHGNRKNSNIVGDLTYPDNARFDADSHMVRWFDHYLKGEANDVDREPAVRYYVMGSVTEADAPGNVWREAADWPVASENTSYYLECAGRLTTAVPTALDGSTTFLADPVHPNSIPGRNFPGAADAREFEAQSEVRTFTTEPLSDPVEWTGRVSAELFVSSTARDTDFIVRVSDVYPDGRSILLMDYIQRARYRDGYEREVLLVPSQVTKTAFDIGWTSQIFNRGHCIRVTIASTGAPFYEPNPNTGEPLTIEFPEKNAIIARNTVHHSALYASRVIGPVKQH